MVVSPRLNMEGVSGPLGVHDRLEKLPGFGPDEKLSSFIPGLLPKNGSIRNGEPANSTAVMTVSRRQRSLNASRGRPWGGVGKLASGAGPGRKDVPSSRWAG